MKWSFAVCAVLLKTLVLGALIRTPWWAWILFFVLVAWWHSTVITSWTYWTAIEERNRARRPKAK
jgi:hypothetical protein